MQLSIKSLPIETINMIHEKTVEILETAGVVVKSEKARCALVSAGAKLEQDEIVKIPKEMVTSALDKAPKSFVLGARNPKYDFPMPSKKPGHLVDGISTGILDLESGVRRASTKADIIDIGRVFQSLNTGVVAWTGCSALDMPAETHCLHEFAAIIQGTSKHVQLELRHEGEAPYAIEILRTILGSDEEVRRRKIASVLYCPISPLGHDDSMLDAYLALAEFDVPVCAYPCPIMGLTSPASIFSTLCQINAEVLSTLVIFQTVRPGIPVIYGCCSGSVDRVTGDYVDGEASILLSMGAVSLARHYNLPCEVSGGGYDTISTYLIWPDLIEGFGTVDNGMTSDLELMVIQNEIANRIHRIVSGIQIDERTDLTEDIIRKGPGGNFLGCKSTRHLIKEGNEIYYSDLFPDSLRHTRDEEAAMRRIANAYIRERLKGPFEDELPEETAEAINHICQQADRELASDEGGAKK